MLGLSGFGTLGFWAFRLAVSALHGLGRRV